MTQSKADRCRFRQGRRDISSLGSRDQALQRWLNSGQTVCCFRPLAAARQDMLVRATLTIECMTKKDRDALLPMRIDAGTAQPWKISRHTCPRSRRPSSMLNEHANLVEAERETKSEDLC